MENHIRGKLMKFYLVLVSIILYSLASFTGCVSYSTLQSAKTLEPGQILAGGGSAFAIANGGSAVVPEFNARVGIVRNFDLGAKYILPSLYFLDGKYQFIDAPVILSADLGWSYFSYTGSLGKSRGTTTCWYPMLIAGQEHWYFGVKEVYFSTQGEFEFFGLNKFQGSGWITTNIVAGGVIGNKIRFLPEVNILIPRSGKALLVPAVGLQFVF